MVTAPISQFELEKSTYLNHEQKMVVDFDSWPNTLFSDTI
jgi:hypothetical protein